MMKMKEIAAMTMSLLLSVLLFGCGNTSELLAEAPIETTTSSSTTEQTTLNIETTTQTSNETITAETLTIEEPVELKSDYPKFDLFVNQFELKLKNILHVEDFKFDKTEETYHNNGSIHWYSFDDGQRVSIREDLNGNVDFITFMLFSPSLFPTLSVNGKNDISDRHMCELLLPWAVQYDLDSEEEILSFYQKYYYSSEIKDGIETIDLRYKDTYLDSMIRYNLAAGFASYEAVNGKMIFN